jgi:septum formation protein
MNTRLILASGSKIRAQMLRNANVPFDVLTARVDEEMVKQSLESEQAKPWDIADTLAEIKARKVSEKQPDALVLGCDQVLDHGGQILSKPETPDAARAQLQMLRGGRHMLLSAAVIVENGKPIWRHVGQVRMLMRAASDSYIDSYVDRNWDSIRHSVGGYKLEEEGVRLFTRVDGDYFTVLGMPLLELLAYLTLRGDLEQ